MAHRLVHHYSGVVCVLFGVVVLAVSGNRWTLTSMEHVPSNSALLTDAFHSALRAARGAAKRER